MGLHRTHRRRADRLEAKETKAKNRVFKDAERDRRRTRVIAKIKAQKFPYTPAIMSWLSRELEKPASKISPADVQTAIK